MKPQLETVFEEREDELLKLLRTLDFGVIGGGGVEVEGLVIDPAGRPGHAVIVGAKGDAEEGTDGSGGGDEASARKDAAVGGFVAVEAVRMDRGDFKLQGRLSLPALIVIGLKEATRHWQRRAEVPRSGRCAGTFSAIQS